MRIVAILNRDGGTLRSLDVEEFGERACRTFEEAGHACSVRVVSGGDLVEALEEAAADDGTDAILAGGGDGTISAAAAVLAGTDKALAVLPAGTMNLFARGLGIPLDIDDAIPALAGGTVRAVDVASANGETFIHQFSIGMHPTVLHERSRLTFASRIGKMFASMRAAVTTLWRPPRLRVELETPDARMKAVTSSIGVTNNLFGEGHLPYAEMPDRGVLGIYVTRARSRGDMLVFLLNLAIGRWRKNEQVDIHETDRVLLTILSHGRRFKCSLDGELRDLAKETELRIHPGALKVLVPVAEDAA